MNLELKILLILKGVTQPELAKKAGTTQATISRTIHGKTKSHHIRAAIADALGLPMEQLWPEKSNKKAA